MEGLLSAFVTLLVMLQSASTTTMHLNILTGFQLRIREALRWVSPTSDCHSAKLLHALAASGSRSLPASSRSSRFVHEDTDHSVHEMLIRVQVIESSISGCDAI